MMRRGSAKTDVDFDVGREHRAVAIENIRPRRRDRIGRRLMHLPQFRMHGEIDELAADDAIDEHEAEGDEPDAPRALVELGRQKDREQATPAAALRAPAGVWPVNFLGQMVVVVAHGSMAFPA